MNTNGESGSCGSFPIGEAPGEESPCKTPGITVVTDAAGDNSTTAAQRDIRSVSFAELYDPASARNKLYITIKGGSFAPLNTPPPSSRWTVYFTRGTTEWFVTMVTDDTASPERRSIDMATLNRELAEFEAWLQTVAPTAAPLPQTVQSLSKSRTRLRPARQLTARSSPKFRRER